MFTRTSCACADCKQCCKDQPGSLVPGDFERIAAHLGERPEVAQLHFWASPGALVMDSTTGRQFRIGTITPRRLRREGRCVFLDEQERCRIHAVAPAGCALFDTHMSAREGALRGQWVARAQQDPAYQALRASLIFAESWKGKSL